jgi:hypothetical protein
LTQPHRWHNDRSGRGWVEQCQKKDGRTDSQGVVAAETEVYISTVTKISMRWHQGDCHPRAIAADGHGAYLPRLQFRNYPKASGSGDLGAGLQTPGARRYETADLQIMHHTFQNMALVAPHGKRMRR